MKKFKTWTILLLNLGSFILSYHSLAATSASPTENSSSRAPASSSQAEFIKYHGDMVAISKIKKADCVYPMDGPVAQMDTCKTAGMEKVFNQLAYLKAELQCTSLDSPTEQDVQVYFQEEWALVYVKDIVECKASVFNSFEAQKDVSADNWFFGNGAAQACLEINCNAGYQFSGKERVARFHAATTIRGFIPIP